MILMFFDGVDVKVPRSNSGTTSGANCNILTGE